MAVGAAMAAIACPARAGTSRPSQFRTPPARFIFRSQVRAGKREPGPIVRPGRGARARYDAAPHVAPHGTAMKARNPDASAAA